MAEQTPLTRQWIVLRTLCARHYGVTVREIAAKMGVSDKTIRRNLEAFQRVGFPLEESVGEHGLKKWRIDATKTTPGLSFTFDEAIAQLARKPKAHQAAESDVVVSPSDARSLCHS